MFRLFESIRLNDGIMANPELHEARMARSLLDLCGREIRHTLQSIVIPAYCQAGLFKCRVVYREEIESVEFVPYRVRTINSVRIVKADGLEYSYKYCDREGFNSLLKENSGFDELLLLTEGRLTDSTFSNLAFYDGVKWYTPSMPLLPGTRRQALLNEGKIIPREILSADLEGFILVSFINAMTELGELVFPINRLVREYDITKTSSFLQ